MSISRMSVLATLLFGLGIIPCAGLAASSYDSCTGFIDSLPTVITKQGEWCLRKDLSTAITSGSAITISANNVTVDCNNYKIGGLAGGDNSTASGISSTNRQNATVRHCNVRGFFSGIDVHGGAGHLVEDNRLDNNLFMGIQVAGDNSLVRNNRVFDTGSERQIAYGIASAGADVIDNIVSGVLTTGTQSNPSQPHGIIAGVNGVIVHGNSIRGLVGNAGSPSAPIGIAFRTKGVVVDRNRITAETPQGSGIDEYALATADADATCSNNIVRGFSSNYVGCVAEVGNIDLP